MIYKFLGSLCVVGAGMVFVTACWSLGAISTPIVGAGATLAMTSLVLIALVAIWRDM